MRNSDQLHAQCGTVLERVLLAIIEAHTNGDSDGDRLRRLEVAMSALVGPWTASDRTFEEAIDFMERERRREVSAMELAPQGSSPASRVVVRTLSELSLEAAREIIGCTVSPEDQVTAQRLCHFYHRRNEQANHFDCVDDAIQSEAVERICAELEEWGFVDRASVPFRGSVIL